MKFIKNNLSMILYIIGIGIILLMSSNLVSLLSLSNYRHTIWYQLYYLIFIIIAILVIVLGNKNGKDRNLINSILILTILSSLPLTIYYYVAFRTYTNISEFVISLAIAFYIIIVFSKKDTDINSLFIPIGVLIIISLPSMFSGDEVSVCKELIYVALIFSIISIKNEDYIDEYYN